jgi:hypothetical protein
MTVSLDPRELVEYAREPADAQTPNPLHRLAALAEAQPERLRAMQHALADARWLLHYRSREQVAAAAGAAGAAAASAHAPSAAALALVHHLVLAAKQRTRRAISARRPTPTDGRGAQAAGAGRR